MSFENVKKIWMNGKLIDFADAKIHIFTHALHYGSGVFEGERCYDTARGPAIFRLDDHLDRLFWSAKIYRMVIPYTIDQ
ncbi:MAG: branched-chain amino acid transaminase, partial [Acidobacteriota bacterium]